MSEAENTQQPAVAETAPVETKPSVNDLPHKVFVGNLSFQTTEIQLSEFFASVGKVVLAKIITRGTRSLGYGFVAFETPEAAEAAVEQLNKKELGGREINVEVAKPKSELPPRERRPRRGRFPGRGRRGGFRGRGRRQYNRDPSRIDQEDETEEGQVVDYEETNDERPITSRRGGRQGRGGFRGRRGGRFGYRSGGRRFRGNSRRRSEPSGEPSKTTLFIANLPFSVNDEKLKEIFSDYKVTAAHVATRRGSGYSKGFGFVEFESNEEQVRALETLNGINVEGRELVLKISMTEESGRKNSEDVSAEPKPEESKPEETQPDATA